MIEARVTYGFAALVFAGLAFIFALMLYDDDPRTWWDFVIVTLGVAAAVFAAANLYIGRRRLALRERHFGASLHHERRAPPGAAGLRVVPHLAAVRHFADRDASVFRHARALAGHRANEQSAD